MVFFNYSTMQMAAKIVYYGPGLGGKTTNLHWIYQHTASDSRGEMVSLETETDRTLFFDLLPIDVGTIAGFNTRLQLYTVPGQVFYNTTRKLVLKGVDGVVFVADSQRPMLQANLDSFKNLEENLAEMGLTTDSVPVVLQYNKRDLADILSVDEMNQALNPKGFPSFEASAVTGEGVLETLKGVSRLTLMSLKQRLAAGSGSQDESPVVTVRPGQRKPDPPPSVAAKPPTPARPPVAKPSAGTASGVTQRPPTSPGVAQKPPTSPGVAQKPPTSPGVPSGTSPGVKAKKRMDALGELEQIRRQTMGGRAAAAKPQTNGNGHKGQLFRDIQLTLQRADFARAKRFNLSLQVVDDDQKVMDAVQNFEVEIDNAAALEKVLLKLNIALRPKE